MDSLLWEIRNSCMNDYKNMDEVQFATDFEEYLESQYPNLSGEQIAELGRKVMNFLDSKK